MSADPEVTDLLPDPTLAELDALDPAERRSVARYLTGGGLDTGASLATRAARTVRGELVEIRQRDGYALAVVDHGAQANVFRVLYRVRLEPRPTGGSSLKLTYLGRVL